MSTWITENFQIVPAAPVDLNTAGLSGPWVSLKNYAHAAVVLIKAVGAVGEPAIITLQQATAVAGTGAKALAAITRIDVKSGADVTAIGQFTKVVQAALSTYTPAAGNTQAVYVIEFDADQLDLANGFDCFRATIADVGATAQLGTLFYILGDCRYPGQFPPSAIVD